jgi:FixJ family two-component response regulator
LLIHVIEDDSAVSDALNIVLTDFGHTVVCYPDAETFLAKPLPTSDDVVVVDVGLPGLNGDAVIKHLNSLKVPPRIIAISGRPKNLLNRSLDGLSQLTLLRKPLSIAALSEHLGEA